MSKFEILTEPQSNEDIRVNPEGLRPESIKFAYQLRIFGDDTTPKPHLEAPEPGEYFKLSRAPYYDRFYTHDSADLGLVLTDIDKDRIELDKDGEPEIYRMGKKRRRLALVQRAAYFQEKQSPEVDALLTDVEQGNTVTSERSNRLHPAIEQILGVMDIQGQRVVTKTVALEELGYRKRSSDEKLSREAVRKTGLYHKIGKYPRFVAGMGSMPPITGGRDALSTAIIGNMLGFIPRNSLFAEDIDRQIALAKDVRQLVHSLEISPKNKERALRNLGASLGTDNPQQVLEDAKRLYHEGGVRLFRIYTINADPRVVETARLLRQEFGDEIEIFVGQVADKAQALQLIASDIRVDAIILGHGGGRQCTSADNGMGVTTLEEIIEITSDARFNGTSLGVEGSVGRNIGTMLLLGVDFVLYNQRLLRGIESPAGDLFVKEKKTGKIVQLYPGSASPVTQIIEASNPTLHDRRIDRDGRTKNPEGKPGFWYFSRKASSMTYWIKEIGGDAARTLADMGVSSLSEMRRLMARSDIHPFRHLSAEAKEIGGAYRNTR